MEWDVAIGTLSTFRGISSESGLEIGKLHAQESLLVLNALVENQNLCQMDSKEVFAKWKF